MHIKTINQCLPILIAYVFFVKVYRREYERLFILIVAGVFLVILYYFHMTSIVENFQKKGVEDESKSKWGNKYSNIMSDIKEITATQENGIIRNTVSKIKGLGIKTMKTECSHKWSDEDERDKLLTEIDIISTKYSNLNTKYIIIA